MSNEPTYIDLDAIKLKAELFYLQKYLNNTEDFRAEWYHQCGLTIYHSYTNLKCTLIYNQDDEAYNLSEIETDGNNYYIENMQLINTLIKYNYRHPHTAILFQAEC